MDMAKQNTKRPPVIVTGKILHETANAILIEVEGTGIWFPLSTVHEIHPNPEDVWKSTVKVDWWIADKKGVAR